MQALYQEGSITLPTIDLNPDSGQLLITGRSIPEHPVNFYQPIENWITEYISTNPSKINLFFHLDYLNTHSIECILLILKKLEDYYKSSGNEVSVEWNFDEDDEDMEILGEDLASLVDFPFKIEVKK